MDRGLSSSSGLSDAIGAASMILHLPGKSAVFLLEASFAAKQIPESVPVKREGETRSIE